MGQSLLTSLNVLSVENRVARGIDFEYVVNQFVTLKSRRANFKCITLVKFCDILFTCLLKS